MTTTNDVIKAYVKLRSKRDAIKAKADQEIAVINVDLDKLEAFLLAKMQEEGVTSFKSEYGTAFKNTTDYTTVSDWDAVLAFIKDNEAYHLLEKRVNKVAVRDYMDQGAIPPGVSYNTRTNVAVRRPSSKV